MAPKTTPALLLLVAAPVHVVATVALVAVAGGATGAAALQVPVDGLVATSVVMGGPRLGGPGGRVGASVRPVTPTCVPQAVVGVPATQAMAKGVVVRGLPNIHAVGDAHDTLHATGGNAEGAVVGVHTTYVPTTHGPPRVTRGLRLVDGGTVAKKVTTTPGPVPAPMEVPVLGRPSGLLPVGDATGPGETSVDGLHVGLVVAGARPALGLVLQAGRPVEATEVAVRATPPPSTTSVVRACRPKTVRLDGLVLLVAVDVTAVPAAPTVAEMAAVAARTTTTGTFLDGGVPNRPLGVAMAVLVRIGPATDALVTDPAFPGVRPVTMATPRLLAGAVVPSTALHSASIKCAKNVTLFFPLREDLPRARENDKRPRVWDRLTRLTCFYFGFQTKNQLFSFFLAMLSLQELVSYKIVSSGTIEC